MFFSLILRKLAETCFLLMRQFINFYCVIIQIICWSITSRTPKNMESSSAKSRMLQLWIKYLRQSLVFMWNRAKGNIQFLFFKSFLLVSKKNAILGGRLSTMLYYEVLRICWYFHRTSVWSLPRTFEATPVYYVYYWSSHFVSLVVKNISK